MKPALSPRCGDPVFAVAICAHIFASQNRWSQARCRARPVSRPQGPSGEDRQIEIKQGDKTLALARDKDGWPLSDRGGYPVKADAVRALLVKLADAELVEPKTRNQERYALLELEDPKGKDAKSRLVRLLDDKGAVLAEAIVGKKRSAVGGSKGGTYVRKPGDEQTWLSNADLDLAVRDWVQANVSICPRPRPPRSRSISRARSRSSSRAIRATHQICIGRHARGQEAEGGRRHRCDRTRGRQHRPGGRAQAPCRAGG